VLPTVTSPSHADPGGGRVIFVTGNRRGALDDFYARLGDVADAHGGPRRLADCTSRTGWPAAGVYYVLEAGELREDGETPRVVRVGTHALTATSRRSLWPRLRAHRGTVGGRNPGGGNHRQSVFRLHVGTALILRDGDGEAAPTWGVRSPAPPEVRAAERELERAVSRHIGAMSVVVVGVDDRHDRALLERTSIALLSNYDREPIDPPSERWLGHHADREAVRGSGLWNVNHVTDELRDAAVLELIRSPGAGT
jgi:hypothetical protein